MKYGETNVCNDKHEYVIEKDSWYLIVREVELTYDEKENTLFNNGHTLPCLHDDGFCHPTILTPYTIVWFPDDLCLLFSIHSFIGRMSKLGNRYWLETERFFDESNNTHTPPSDTNSDKNRLSCFETYPERRTFCSKLTPLHIIQLEIMHFNLHNKVFKTIFNIGKPMTHKTRKIVKFITVLHYLTNLHHVISKTA